MQESLFASNRNRWLLAAPQGLYPCAGGQTGMEKWLAISIDMRCNCSGRCLPAPGHSGWTNSKKGVLAIRNRARWYANQGRCCGRKSRRVMPPLEMRLVLEGKLSSRG
jgi:hypothetical protein